MPGGSGNKAGIGQPGPSQGAGSGANTVGNQDMLDGKQVLSNRDKAQHSRARGQDSKAIEAEQDQE